MKKDKSEKFFESAVITDNWDQTFEDLRKKNIVPTSNLEETNVSDSSINLGDAKITELEDNMVYNLDPIKGLDFIKSYNMAGYDESIQKIETLSGSVYFTCHTRVGLNISNYSAACELTANYFTRSKDLADKSDVFIYVDPNEDQIGSSFKRKLDDERFNFLCQEKIVPNNSILIVDGPLIGRQLSSRTIRLTKALQENSILTVYVTKNSDSLQLVNYYCPNKYHSDLHWASDNLKAGQRSRFLQYVDQNAGHSEVFCYLKSFNKVSPLRVSIETKQYHKFKDLFEEAMDMIYYLVLDHGEPKNPQVRLIAVAEYYAKDIMKIANPYGRVINMGLVPSVNQSRFGRA